MAEDKEMSLEQREKRLSELLMDAINLKFNKNLIEDYQRQLGEIRAELQEIKQKQKEFMKLLKSKIQE